MLKAEGRSGPRMELTWGGALVCGLGWGGVQLSSLKCSLRGAA